MTAEVALMNRNGVALAADSAVTIGREARKIYTSAEKLFQLSEACPVGVMIYGSAAFLGVPWDTIIKTYRAKHGSDVKSHVHDYASHFLSFLKRSRNLFPIKSQDDSNRSLVAAYFLSLREQIKRKLGEEAEKKDGLSDDDIPTIVDQLISKSFEGICSHTDLTSIDQKSRQAVIRRLTPSVVKIVDEIFEKLPFGKKTKQLLVDAAFQFLFRECFGIRLSGLVFAGFGNDEFMPTLVHFHLEEMVNNCLRVIQKDKQSVGVDSEGVVMPFAQQDMVQSFMEGIHGELAVYMTDTTNRLFTGAFKVVLDAIKKSDAGLGQQIEKAIQPVLSGLLTKLFEDWQRHRTQYWRPVLDVVSSLPKDELAAMSEALVNLTSFRRRVTNVPETVGGPIDVAVITKGDGFVWIKRKHYFAPELNPRIMARYERKNEGE